MNVVVLPPILAALNRTKWSTRRCGAVLQMLDLRLKGLKLTIINWFQETLKAMTSTAFTSPNVFDSTSDTKDGSDDDAGTDKKPEEKLSILLGNAS
jgi:hypothetical protein